MYSDASNIKAFINVSSIFPAKLLSRLVQDFRAADLPKLKIWLGTGGMYYRDTTRELAIVLSPASSSVLCRALLEDPQFSVEKVSSSLDLMYVGSVLDQGQTVEGVRSLPLRYVLNTISFVNRFFTGAKLKGLTESLSDNLATLLLSSGSDLAMVESLLSATRHNQQISVGQVLTLLDSLSNDPQQPASSPVVRRRPADRDSHISTTDM